MTNPTLCLPDTGKSCFACCPPIRPAGYEHVQYINIIKRILRENTNEFSGRRGAISPISGFSCWALGYLDKNHCLVGCLLHPNLNQGRDLRHRVHYGDKCRRELCPEASVFHKLPISVRRFWLHLADGFDAFQYSSWTINPIPKLTGWGPRLLGLISQNENSTIFTKESFFETYPFFVTKLNPRANAYPLLKLVEMNHTDLLKSASFRRQFEIFSANLSTIIREHSGRGQGGPYTHLLGCDNHFLDFLRLSAGILKIDKEGAEMFKRIVDRTIKRFPGSSGPIKPL